MKRLICLCIIGELILANIGFCGHLHIHIFPREVSVLCPYIPVEEELAEHSNNHEHNDHHEMDHKEDLSKEHFNCACFGGFIGILTPIIIKIPNLKYSFYNVENIHYESFWMPSIYHPPMNVF